LILHQWQKIGKYVERKFPIKQNNNKQASNKTSATPLKTNQFEQKAKYGELQQTVFTAGLLY